MYYNNNKKGDSVTELIITFIYNGCEFIIIWMTRNLKQA